MSDPQKPTYAAIPLRALGDAALSGADLRTLGVVAAHDRFAKNHVGCFASYKRLAAMAGLAVQSLKRSVANLIELGYLRAEPNPMDARRRILFVEYTEADAAAMRGDGRSFTKPARLKLAPAPVGIGDDMVIEKMGAARPVENRNMVPDSGEIGIHMDTDWGEIGIHRKCQVVENVDRSETNIFLEKENRFREARLGDEKVGASGEAEAEIERAEAVAKQVRSREMEPEDGLDALGRIAARLSARGLAPLAQRVEAMAEAMVFDAAEREPPVELLSARASPALLATRLSRAAMGAA